jgi:hypothetical protein
MANGNHIKVTGDLNQINVDDLYDKDKYDLSTMEQEDVMQLLQYVFFFLLDIERGFI